MSSAARMKPIKLSPSIMRTSKGKPVNDILEDKKEVISSPSNNSIKHIKGLLLKKYRDKYHLFIAEGDKLVREAISSDLTVDMIVFSQVNGGTQNEIYNLAEQKGIRCIITTDTIFKSLSDTQSPQGVMAIVNEKTYKLDKITDHTNSFLVLLDGITDPGNLGTIIRTVDAAGGAGVILLNGCVDPYNPKVVRSTMGSIFRLPIFQGYDTVELTNKLSQSGYHIVTSHLQGTNIFQWSGDFAKTALVIGSESHGVSQEIINASDSLVKIPMTGGAESLNASVAAGILIYEILRKGIKMYK